MDEHFFHKIGEERGEVQAHVDCTKREDGFGPIEGKQQLQIEGEKIDLRSKRCVSNQSSRKPRLLEKWISRRRGCNLLETRKIQE